MKYNAIPEEIRNKGEDWRKWYYGMKEAGFNEQQTLDAFNRPSWPSGRVVDPLLDRNNPIMLAANGSGTRTDASSAADEMSRQRDRAVGFLESALKSGVLTTEQAQEILLGAVDGENFDSRSVAKGTYNAYLTETQAMRAASTPYESNQRITQKYAEIFGNDQFASWFGLGTVASAKVGDALSNLRMAQAFYSTDGAMVPPTVGAYSSFEGGSLFGDLAGGASVLFDAFTEGNKAVFDSQVTAYRIYQDGGMDAIRSVADFVYTQQRGGDFLVAGYQSYENSLYAYASGDMSSYQEQSRASLLGLANLEQRITLQPMYDKPGVRQAINDLSATGESWLYSKLVGDPTAVHIGATSITFGGTDIGNVDQRMTFVQANALAFMERYSAPGGVDALRQVHQDLLYRQYGVGVRR